MPLAATARSAVARAMPGVSRLRMKAARSASVLSCRSPALKAMSALRSCQERSEPGNHCAMFSAAQAGVLSVWQVVQTSGAPAACDWSGSGFRKKWSRRGSISM